MWLTEVMSTNAIPPIYDALIPSIVVSDGAKAIQFYTTVFGAEELMRMNFPDGVKIAHAELKIRGHVFMLGDECPQMGVSAPKPDGPAPATSVMIYFPAVDVVFEIAVANGAKVVMPPTDMFWGDRYAKFIDPFGHQWGIATHVRDVSPEECAKAMAEWGKSQSEKA